MYISGGQLNIDWVPKTVYNSMDFCRFTSAAGTTKGVITLSILPIRLEKSRRGRGKEDDKYKKAQVKYNKNLQA